MSRTHEIKCWPEPFAAVLAGTKRYEIRKDDRGYAVGDEMVLKEWEPHSDVRNDEGTYGYNTGRTLTVRVTYLTPGGAWGLPADLCVMSIEPMPSERERYYDVARESETTP